jgi:soluble lytic murein transglycosylase-like protein
LATRLVPAVPYARWFVAASQQYAVPLPILLAVADHESGFRATAVHHDANGTEDVGIMQLNLQAQGLSYGQAADPSFAIPYAARLLHALYVRYGSWDAALQAYNSGQPSGDPQYAAAVLGLARRYGYQGGGGTALPAVESGPNAVTVNAVRVGLLVLAAILFVVVVVRL